MYNKMVMVKYTAEHTLTSNNPPEIAGDPHLQAHMQNKRSDKLLQLNCFYTYATGTNSLF